jgi:hypothetical protein
MLKPTPGSERTRTRNYNYLQGAGGAAGGAPTVADLARFTRLVNAGTSRRSARNQIRRANNR